jgi:hypothetical protein
VKLQKQKGKEKKERKKVYIERHLIEGILNRHDWSLGDEALVEIPQLVGRKPVGRVRVGVLEVEVVLAVLVELRGGHVHADLDLAGVAGLLDGVAAEGNGFLDLDYMNKKFWTVFLVQNTYTMEKISAKNDVDADKKII